MYKYFIGLKLVEMLKTHIGTHSRKEWNMLNKKMARYNLSLIYRNTDGVIILDSDQMPTGDSVWYGCGPVN